MTTLIPPASPVNLAHPANPAEPANPADPASAGTPRTAAWWRRNAPWLLALPLAVGLAATASAYRVWIYWWPDGFHHEVAHVGLGEPATLRGEYYDLGLDVPERDNTVVLREIDVTVLSVDQVDELPDHAYGYPVPIPDGSAAYLVTIRFEAALRTDLSLCRIVLVGSDGTRYGDDTMDVVGSVNRCAPADADEFLSTKPAWAVASPVLVDEGAEITQVQVGFEGPEYVTADLP